MEEEEEEGEGLPKGTYPRSRCRDTQTRHTQIIGPKLMV